MPPTVVQDIIDLYLRSAHVRDLGLQAGSDDGIWARAAVDGYLIVTKDDDFRQRSFLYGFPPKVLWLRIGNCRRRDITNLLQSRVEDIKQFAADPLMALLVLTRSR
ncbi:MAG: DUF5615 family PIN-like protein [Gemmatimonadaceae bacterium]